MSLPELPENPELPKSLGLSGVDSHPAVFTVSSYEQAREVFRQKDLRQALYDAGDVVMADVLVNLHGDDHRARRRLENRLFRKDTHLRYERELFPPLLEATLAPAVLAGRGELVTLSHQIMMNLAALTAGVDRPAGTPEETLRLYAYLMTFIEGATLAHYSGDVSAKEAQVAQALKDFDHEFLQPSIARRSALLKDLEVNRISEGDLPQDVLTTLLRNQDQLELPGDVLLREVCFFLLAGAHTSATAFLRTLDQIFVYADSQPDLAERAKRDPVFLQRCVHETIRLNPSSPVAMRWAVQDLVLSDGTRVAAGEKVIIDLMAANRDPQVFGETAEQFQPERNLDRGVAPWGLSFGLGMHACIGQDLAAGVDPAGLPPEAEHLLGLVPAAVSAVLRAGGRPDPEAAAKLDPLSARNYWSEYPVLFGDGAP